MSSSLAQDTLTIQKYYPKPKITAIEFLFGVNSSTIRGINSTTGGGGGGVYYSTVLNNRIGYSIGVGLVHTFSRYFELHARILWETKGISQKTDSISFSTGTLGRATISSSEENSDYITISLLPQLILGKCSHFNVGAGGYFGLLQNSKVNIQYYYPSRSATQKGYFNPDDFGLLFNFGYTCHFKNKTKFTIQFSNSYGLRQISKFHDLYSGSPPLYNNSYSLMLGIRLANSKKLFNKLQ